jgi:hypothetical protein
MKDSKHVASCAQINGDLKLCPTSTQMSWTLCRRRKARRGEVICDGNETGVSDVGENHVAEVRAPNANEDLLIRCGDSARQPFATHVSSFASLDYRRYLTVCLRLEHPGIGLLV